MGGIVGIQLNYDGKLSELRSEAGRRSYSIEAIEVRKFGVYLDSKAHGTGFF